MERGNNYNRPQKGQKIKTQPIKDKNNINKIAALIRPSPRNHALFFLGIHTGLRPRDLLNIRLWQVLNIEVTQTIRVIDETEGLKKTIFIDKECADSIKRLLKERGTVDQNDFLFTTQKGSFSIHYLNNLIKKWCKNQHLQGNYGCHSLRKTYGYHQFIDGKKDLRDLMAFFNHPTVARTKEYLCLTAEDLYRKKRMILRDSPQSESENIKKLKKENAHLKQELEKQKRNAEKFRTFFENARDEIVYTDKAGRIVEVNSATNEIFGWTREESIGKYFWDIGILDSHTAIMLKKTYQDVIKTGHVNETHEVEAFHKDGRTVYVEVTTKHIEKGGQIKGLLNIIRDITDRKIAQRDLADSEEAARSLLNATTDAAMLLDTQGMILDLNYAYAETIGKPVNLIIGTSFWQHIPTDTGRKKLRSSFESVVTSGESIRFEDRFQEVWLDNVIYPIMDSRGQVSRVAVFSHDITMRKRAEALLRKHRDDLEELVAKRTQNLKEASIALKVLLKKREEDKNELKENIMSNTKELIRPLMEELKSSKLEERLRSIVEILEDNLENIVSSFGKNLSSAYLSLTPMELKIANMIKQGKTTKEVAAVLKISPRTVDIHRYRIRKKIGISNKKANLVTSLLSFE